RAAEAAAKLGETKPPKALKPLLDLVRHPSTSEEVKRHAVRALGLIGDADAHKTLAGLLASEDPELVAEAALAIGRIGAPDAGKALLDGCGKASRALAGKRIEGSKIHYSDWDRWLSAVATILDAVAMVKPSGA